MTSNPRRGDVVLVNFDPAMSGEAARTRPAVVITNDAANELSPVLVVVPLTTNFRSVYPHEVVLPAAQTGLEQDSKAQVALIRHVSRARLRRTVGWVPGELMLELDARLREHLGL